MFISVKDILPQKTNIFSSICLALCSPVYLLKHKQHLHIIWKIKAVFRLFRLLHSLCAILLSSGIAGPIIPAETGVTASTRVIRSGQ